MRMLASAKSVRVGAIQEAVQSLTRFSHHGAFCPIKRGFLLRLYFAEEVAGLQNFPLRRQLEFCLLVLLILSGEFPHQPSSDPTDGLVITADVLGNFPIALFVPCRMLKGRNNRSPFFLVSSRQSVVAVRAPGEPQCICVCAVENLGGYAVDASQLANRCEPMVTVNKVIPIFAISHDGHGRESLAAPHCIGVFLDGRFFQLTGLQPGVELDVLYTQLAFL
jgi:hypothetical protein